MTTLTLVSCLYDIRQKENSSASSLRRLQDYLSLSMPMLSVSLPMVIYTDDERIVEHVYKTRLHRGLLEKTWIVRLPFEHTFFYKDLDTLKERMNTFPIHNWNKEKDTPLYVLLNNNKFDFLERTIQSNPFQTEFFLWMDMGIQHCTNATEEEWKNVSQSWPQFINLDKQHIHQLRIHTVLKRKEETWKDYFQFIYHHVAGGLFGGYRDCLVDYIRLFKETWNTILYEEGWWQLDEAVMTIITENYPEKFRFFYGDYDGLLSNFIHTKKSFFLVFQTAQRYLESQDFSKTIHVLDSIDTEGLPPYYLEQYKNMQRQLFTKKLI